MLLLLAVIERWEILQAHGAQRKLTSDLGELTTWLDCVLPELERLQRGKDDRPSIQDVESSIRKLKVTTVTFFPNLDVERKDNCVNVFFFNSKGDPEDIL